MDFCQVSYRCGLLKVGKFGSTGNLLVIIIFHKCITCKQQNMCQNRLSVFDGLSICVRIKTHPDNLHYMYMQKLSRI